MPQACQDPASDNLNADLDLSLVAWLVGPRRNDGSAVMPRHVGIGPVDHRFVKARLGDPGLEIVADRLAGDAAEISEGADMCRDPIRQLLAPHRLGVGEARGAQDGDKNLYRDDLAGEAINDLAGTAGEVDCPVEGQGCSRWSSRVTSRDRCSLAERGAGTASGGGCP